VLLTTLQLCPGDVVKLGTDWFPDAATGLCTVVAVIRDKKFFRRKIKDKTNVHSIAFVNGRAGINQPVYAITAISCTTHLPQVFTSYVWRDSVFDVIKRTDEVANFDKKSL
jgi:hypothetical protein